MLQGLRQQGHGLLPIHGCCPVHEDEHLPAEHAGLQPLQGGEEAVSDMAVFMVLLVFTVAIAFLLLCVKVSMTLEKIPEDIFRTHEEAESR